MHPTDGNFFDKMDPAAKKHKFCPVLQEIDAIVSKDQFDVDTRNTIIEFTKK